jgi:hypothetical protein
METYGAVLAVSCVALMAPNQSLTEALRLTPQRVPNEAGLTLNGAS